jgi:hypothetical protein
MLDPVEKAETEPQLTEGRCVRFQGVAIRRGGPSRGWLISGFFSRIDVSVLSPDRVQVSDTGHQIRLQHSDC